MYDPSLAVERVRAAKEAAASLGFAFTLTARAECHLVDHPEPFKESITRGNLYREAGADCLYVPGIRDAKTIGSLVNEIDAPINVVMGLSGSLLTVSELEALGVKRVSVGGALMRATFGLLRRAAAEIQEQGTFKFTEGQVPDEELCEFFSSRTSTRGRAGT